MAVAASMAHYLGVKSVGEVEMIVMGARGHNADGTGGEIAIYWNESSCRPFLLLQPGRFSYWLFNWYVKRWPRKGLR